MSSKTCKTFVFGWISKGNSEDYHDHSYIQLQWTKTEAFKLQQEHKSSIRAHTTHYIPSHLCGKCNLIFKQNKSLSQQPEVILVQIIYILNQTKWFIEKIWLKQTILWGIRHRCYSHHGEKVLMSRRSSINTYIYDYFSHKAIVYDFKIWKIPQKSYGAWEFYVCNQTVVGASLTSIVFPYNGSQWWPNNCLVTNIL